MHLGRSCDFSIKTSIFKRYICICIHVFLKYDYPDISSSPTYTTSFGFLHSRLCHRARIDKRTHNISNISYRKNFRFCLLAARIEHLPCFVCLYLLYIFGSVRVRTYIYILYTDKCIDIESDICIYRYPPPYKLFTPVFLII